VKRRVTELRMVAELHGGCVDREELAWWSLCAGRLSWVTPRPSEALGPGSHGGGVARCDGVASPELREKLSKS